jgi:hypothetical protein
MSSVDVNSFRLSIGATNRALPNITKANIADLSSLAVESG